MPLRTGRKVANNLYHQIGDEPSDDDEILGFIKDAAMAATLVEHYNGYFSTWEMVHDLQAKLAVAGEQIEHYRAEVQRLQAIHEPVLMSDASKADTEAAYQRGLEAGRVQAGPQRETVELIKLLLPLRALAAAEEAVKDASAQFAALVAPDEEPVADAPEDCLHDGKKVVTAMQDTLCLECGANLGEQV